MSIPTNVQLFEFQFVKLVLNKKNNSRKCGKKINSFFITLQDKMNYKSSELHFTDYHNIDFLILRIIANYLRFSLKILKTIAIFRFLYFTTRLSVEL
jgi:hypothetical protein